MIIYDLQCDNEHRFEGWFRSAADFDNQLSRHLIACPQCESHNVSQFHPQLQYLNIARQRHMTYPKEYQLR